MSDVPAKQSDDCSPINYARVVILGDRGVGKTALIKVIYILGTVNQLHQEMVGGEGG